MPPAYSATAALAVLSEGGAIMGKQMAMVNAVIATLLLGITFYAYWMKKRNVLR